MSRRTTILAALTAALLAGIGGFLLVRGDDDSKPEQARTQAVTPTETTPAKRARPEKKPAKRRKAPPPRRRKPASGDVRLGSFGGRGPLIGLADNRPETLTDRRFARTGIKHVRVAVPFDDVALGGRRRAVQDAFFANARQTGVKPLVTFYRSSRGIRILPSEAQFRRHVRPVPPALSLGAVLLDLERGQLPRPAHQP